MSTLHFQNAIHEEKVILATNKEASLGHIDLFNQLLNGLMLTIRIAQVSVNGASEFRMVRWFSMFAVSLVGC